MTVNKKKIDKSASWLREELAKTNQAKAFGKLEQAAGLFAIAAHYDKRKKLIVPFIRASRLPKDWRRSLRL